MTTATEKTRFETVSRETAREVGAQLRGPRCGQQRRCQEAEGDSSAAVRCSIICSLLATKFAFLREEWGLTWVVGWGKSMGMAEPSPRIRCEGMSTPWHEMDRKMGS